MSPRKTLVFGPAYIDRVVRVDRPLIDPAVGGVVDGSAMGTFEDREPSDGRILITGLPSGDLGIELPPDWPGPSGLLVLDDRRRLSPDATDARDARWVRCVSWHDDLGGMGAGYAKALGGRLVLLLGDDSDPIHREIVARLAAEGIDHEPIRVPGRIGEWTLMITSGEFGDKLPVGFRDRNNDADVFAEVRDRSCDLLVAASMTNRRAAEALSGIDATVRLFAPAMRNMIDRSPRVSQFARWIDVLCCNRREWEALDDREEVAWRVSILAVTDGPNGAEIRFTTPNGDPGRVVVPAFPRGRPPRDTNRAGEAFASTLATTLLDGGRLPGPVERDLVERAARRASIAAALVLDRSDFGFPSTEEIDAAETSGIVC